MSDPHNSNDSEPQNKVWLITGTSSGFGRRLVTSALTRGDRVVATARSKDSLETLSSSCPDNLKENLLTVELDVTEGEQSIKDKVDKAAQRWGRIDVLVNNAGRGYPSLTEEGGSSLMRRQFEVNVFGLLNVTTATLPYIRASKGTVVIVGSRSAWRPELPGIGPYAASKAAVHAIAEALSAELAPLNVKVLLIQPGAFRTEGIYREQHFTDNQIPDYDAIRRQSIELFTSIPGKEKGDPDKAMEVLVDVVKGQGVAKDRPWPGYLVLGEDAEAAVRGKCAKVLGVLDEWVDVTRGVNFS